MTDEVARTHSAEDDSELVDGDLVDGSQQRTISHRVEQSLTVVRTSPAEDYALLERAKSGAGDRMLDHMEREQVHRHGREIQRDRDNYRFAVRLLAVQVTLTLAVLAIVAYCVVTRQFGVAVATVVVYLVIFAGALWGQRLDGPKIK